MTNEATIKPAYVSSDRKWKIERAPDGLLTIFELVDAEWTAIAHDQIRRKTPFRVQKRFTDLGGWKWA